MWGEMGYQQLGSRYFGLSLSTPQGKLPSGQPALSVSEKLRRTLLSALWAPEMGQDLEITEQED